MGSLSITHWMIVLAIVAMVFGTKRLRSMGTDLGGAIKGFKEGMQDNERIEAEAATQSSIADTAVDVPTHRPVSHL